MRSTDPTLSTSVSGIADPAEGVGQTQSAPSIESPRRAARRRAEVGAPPAESTLAARVSVPRIDSAVSPRRAARAAREAAAAAALSAGTVGDPLDSVAPNSPAAPTAALPVVRTMSASAARAEAAATAAVPTTALPVLPAAAVSAPAEPAAEAPVVVAPAAPAPTIAPLATPSSPATALAPAFSAGTLAVGIPAPASSTGRRVTFVPSLAESPVAPSRSQGAVVRRRAPKASAGAPTAPRPTRRRTVGSMVRRGAIGAVICGILATSILPALGHSSSAAYASTNPDGSTTVHIGDQTYDVAKGVDNQVLARDGYSATSVVDYEKQVIANRLADTNTTYTGPTAAQYLLHPLYSHDPLDRSQVFDVALQYLGTPYVHGGADPSAFDCSGLIMFVYAQFGISLPHYVPSQDAMGTTIPQSEAVPGDLVVFNTDDHDGFYAGNGMIMDAPKPGGHVSVRPIWDAPHHFVRINP
ncbi:hypothetical protein AX769_03040 [Frondihabitans sp. PAMC 28766]|uniref:C40 family peptidase n=1 Tax=Frondihabitans sp. PAMC 28766 TaxID=1795630 RepID=UPI00078EB5F0|nr:NlpC/P60 family protein [Frondihabitans sp. PAMC 28766]AMM19294.1 hypothetical protein AX769_03040 [Frondihabitans sp. PAMC 28766]